MLRGRSRSCVALALLAGCAANRQATDRLRPTEERLPAFGVTLGAATPAGFVRGDRLSAGMLAGSIATWRRAGTLELDENAERFVLFWRNVNANFGRDPIDEPDPLRNAARNPFGNQRSSPTAFALVATPATMPSLATTMPTTRYARADASADDDGLVRSQATLANNVAYLLVHTAPDGASPEGAAAFDAIAADLRFEPFVPLGKALAPGTRRNVVPGPTDTPVASFCLPEPFLLLGDDGRSFTATDLTLYTPSPTGEDRGWDTYTADLRCTVAGDAVPEGLLDGNGDDFPTPVLEGGNGAVRLAAPATRPRDRKRQTLFVGRARLDAARSLWLALSVPGRVVDDAGGDAALQRLLRATLATARLADDADRRAASKPTPPPPPPAPSPVVRSARQQPFHMGIRLPAGFVGTIRYRLNWNQLEEPAPGTPADQTIWWTDANPDGETLVTQVPRSLGNHWNGNPVTRFTRGDESLEVPEPGATYDGVAAWHVGVYGESSGSNVVVIGDRAAAVAAARTAGNAGGADASLRIYTGWMRLIAPQLTQPHQPAYSIPYIPPKSR